MTIPRRPPCTILNERLGREHHQGCARRQACNDRRESRPRSGSEAVVTRRPCRLDADGRPKVPPKPIGIGGTPCRNSIRLRLLVAECAGKDAMLNDRGGDPLQACEAEDRKSVV